MEMEQQLEVMRSERESTNQRVRELEVERETLNQQVLSTQQNSERIQNAVDSEQQRVIHFENELLRCDEELNQQQHDIGQIVTISCIGGAVTVSISILLVWMLWRMKRKMMNDQKERVLRAQYPLSHQEIISDSMKRKE